MAEFLSDKVRQIINAGDDALSLLDPSQNREECENIIFKATIRRIKETLEMTT